MEPIETRLARIEEHQVFIRGAVIRIEASANTAAEQGQRNAMEIALLKRDDKWRSKIIAGVGGIVGGVFALFINWLSFKKG